MAEQTDKEVESRDQEEISLDEGVGEKKSLTASKKSKKIN